MELLSKIYENHGGNYLFRLLTIKDVVRVDPSMFSDDLNSVVKVILKERYNGYLDKEAGIIITVININNIGTGKVIHGEGAAYYDVELEILAFKPDLQEIVYGEVVEILDFGAFIRIGPLDGLCHISQVMDDYVSLDRKKGVLNGRDSNRVLKEGDRVRARVIAVSLKSATKTGKIGLTMRQPGLGKLEWLEEETKETKPKAKAK